MVTFFSARRFHGVIGCVAFILLGVAFYMEYQLGLEPCPLCMLQRIVFLVIGIVSLLSAVMSAERARKWLSLVVVALSLIGAALAIRHLYLQHLPLDELPACLPGLGYMVEVFPWQEVAKAMIMGTGDCGDVVWTFLGLSIPGWTLVMFLGMALINGWIALTRVKKSLS